MYSPFSLPSLHLLPPPMLCPVFQPLMVKILWNKIDQVSVQGEESDKNSPDEQLWPRTPPSLISTDWRKTGERTSRGWRGGGAIFWVGKDGEEGGGDLAVLRGGGRVTPLSTRGFYWKQQVASCQSDKGIYSDKKKNERFITRRFRVLMTPLPSDMCEYGSLRWIRITIEQMQEMRKNNLQAGLVNKVTCYKSFIFLLSSLFWQNSVYKKIQTRPVSWQDPTMGVH